MKVILLENVKGIGKRHDIKEVPSGYAQNFLLPKKLAERATDEAVARIKQQKQQIEIGKEVELTSLRKDLATISGNEITLSEKANEQGHLFSSIHAKEIAHALHDQKQITLDQKYIALAEPIKALGTYPINIEIQKEKAVFTLTVKRKE